MGFSRTQTSITAQLPAAIPSTASIVSGTKSSPQICMDNQELQSYFPSYLVLHRCQVERKHVPGASRQQEETVWPFNAAVAHSPLTVSIVTIKARWLLWLPLCPPQELTANFRPQWCDNECTASSSSNQGCSDPANLYLRWRQRSKCSTTEGGNCNLITINYVA